ncbi:hypothetical protein SAY87_009767 [Trapa incisa]|uniref:Uncharacterized protein n=1 Tax=Trapa incisa TaxID=236973 RepID=A0AAN7K1P8_9MYRT|nr:hypothetical protein SAY87_009767 [Trapa incisa]
MARMFVSDYAAAVWSLPGLDSNCRGLSLWTWMDEIEELFLSLVPSAISAISGSRRRARHAEAYQRVSSRSSTMEKKDGHGPHPSQVKTKTYAHMATLATDGPNVIPKYFKNSIIYICHTFPSLLLHRADDVDRGMVKKEGTCAGNGLVWSDRELGGKEKDLAQKFRGLGSPARGRCSSSTGMVFIVELGF